MTITHLVYADDAIVFCDAYKDQMMMLRTIFEGVLGLHINWRKSLLNSVDDAQQFQHSDEILGGEMRLLSAVYLGMPLGEKSADK